MDQSVVVLDYGSNTFKAGYANSFPTDEEPRVVTPNLVQVGSADEASNAGSQQPSISVANSGRNAAVSQGHIQDIDQFEAILHHILYQDLAWQQGSEGSMVVAEPLFTSRPDRELIAQLLFETFNVRGMYTQDQAVLSLFTLGRTSGTVVDIGHDKCDIGTVTDGLLNSSSTRRLPTAGAALTSLLQQQLSSSHQLSLAAAQSLKEQCSFAYDTPEEFDADAATFPSSSQALPNQSTTSAPHTHSRPSGSDSHHPSLSHPSNTSAPSQSYALPDGQTINIPLSIAATLGESLFRPSLTQHPTSHSGAGIGLAYSACDAISSIGDFASRRACYDSIVLCGGSSLVKGVAQRFLKELRALAPPSTSPSYIAIPDYLQAEHTARYAPWIGGSVLAKVLGQQNGYVTKLDYEEMGPLAIRRCT